MKKKQVILSVLILVLLVLWIGFIFQNSMNNAVISSGKSGAVRAFINRILAVFHLGPLTEHFVRKLAHFTEFVVEGILLLLCSRKLIRKWYGHLTLPLLCGVLTAMTDETIQKFSEGRASSVIDVWIDTSGVAAGVFSMALLCILIERIRTKKRIK